MSDVKWIKITTDMFDNRKIKAIRKLPEGNNIILIWVMLLSLAGRCNASGMIFLTENIPYTNKMLADELGFEESVICIAINTLEKFGMITTDENFLISINNWHEYQNVDGMDKIREQTRKRVTEYRKRKKEEPLQLEAKDKKNKRIPTSKTNLESFEQMINNDCSFDYIEKNSNLYECIKEWMEYKDQRKPRTSNHYAERGMKGFLKKVISESEKYGISSVIQVINDSISNNYQGVTWDRIEKQKSGTYMDAIKSRVSEVDKW